jgi:hypothetical protein
MLKRRSSQRSESCQATLKSPREAFRDASSEACCASQRRDHRRIESVEENRRGAVSEILKRAERRLPIAVNSDDFPIENGLNRQRLQSARDIRETTREIPLVSRSELDADSRPNSYGSIAVELYLVLPGRTFGQLLHREAEHRLDEARAGALVLTASPSHLYLFLTSLRLIATDPAVCCRILAILPRDRRQPLEAPEVRRTC